MSTDGGPARTPLVLKFGGSSFPGPAAYHEIAAALDARVTAAARPLVAVVSAMPQGTESLRALLHAVNRHPLDTTTAGALTTADLVSAHLLATALHRRGREAAVLPGHRIGMTTERGARWARVRATDPAPLHAALAEYPVVVVPGGQAVDQRGRTTWLGKNSSDVTALALAGALGAPECEIHSDVDGVYSADPHLVRGAARLTDLTYDMAALLSRYGAKVLHRRAVAAARRHGTVIVCRGNRPPFPAGSRVGTTAAHRATAAVVVDVRSRVLRYPTGPTADQALRSFRGEGVEAIRLPGGHLVALIGGYVDEEALRLRHGLPRPHLAGVPVTVVRDRAVVTRLATGPDHAVALAQRLHDRIVAPALRHHPLITREETR